MSARSIADVGAIAIHIDSSTLTRIAMDTISIKRASGFGIYLLAANAFITIDNTDVSTTTVGTQIDYASNTIINNYIGNGGSDVGVYIHRGNFSLFNSTINNYASTG